VILDKKNIKLFWHYIYERHSIYKKKELAKLDYPWTDDLILSKYKFTNVFRDLDVGTKYVINKIIPKSKKARDIIFNIIIYRLYNKIETFDFVKFSKVDSFDIKFFESKLRELKSKGVAIFTNAFLVSGYSSIKGKDKIEKTCNIIDLIHNDIKSVTALILENKNSKYTFKKLKSLNGIGNFLAYQIAVDIGYWNNELFNESKFVVAGPGCKKGIDLLFKDKGDLDYEKCIQYLCDTQIYGFKNMNININELFNDRKDKFLNLMAMENCLCEISKYLKAHYKWGRPRNKY